MYDSDSGIDSGITEIFAGIAIGIRIKKTGRYWNWNRNWNQRILIFRIIGSLFETMARYWQVGIGIRTGIQVWGLESEWNQWSLCWNRNRNPNQNQDVPGNRAPLGATVICIVYNFSRCIIISILAIQSQKSFQLNSMKQIYKFQYFHKKNTHLFVLWRKIWLCNFMEVVLCSCTFIQF